jgi:hypothetical protein
MPSFERVKGVAITPALFLPEEAYHVIREYSEL